jgi:hypothetical protein
VDARLSWPKDHPVGEDLTVAYLASGGVASLGQTPWPGAAWIL